MHCSRCFSANGRNVSMSVKILSVDKGSPADKARIKPGDSLVSINKNAIHDILDYQFYSSEEKLIVELEDRTVTVKKDEYEDLGLNFETYLMDCKQLIKFLQCFFNFHSSIASLLLYIDQNHPETQIVIISVSKSILSQCTALCYTIFILTFFPRKDFS